MGQQGGAIMLRCRYGNGTRVKTRDRAGTPCSARLECEAYGGACWGAFTFTRAEARTPAVRSCLIRHLFVCSLHRSLASSDTMLPFCSNVYQ